MPRHVVVIDARSVHRRPRRVEVSTWATRCRDGPRTELDVDVLHFDGSCHQLPKERNIVSRVGLDVALEALRAYAGSAHRDLEALRRYARIDGVEGDAAGVTGVVGWRCRHGSQAPNPPADREEFLERQRDDGPVAPRRDAARA